MTDRDLFKLTHEELAGMIERLEADRETLRERAEGAELSLRGVWSNLTPALERGGFVTFELAAEPSIDERRALSASIAPLVQELGLRVLVIGPNMKARASHRCESCGKAKK